MKLLKTTVAVVALAAGLAGTAHADALFDHGLQDRNAWETWFNGLSGDFKTGAFFWAGQRSLPHPGSCEQMNSEFASGCTAAKIKLAASDALRHTEPTYKAGWNVWTPAAGNIIPQLAPEPAPAPVAPLAAPAAVAPVNNAPIIVQAPAPVIVQQAAPAAPAAPVAPVAAPAVEPHVDPACQSALRASFKMTGSSAADADSALERMVDATQDPQRRAAMALMIGEQNTKKASGVIEGQCNALFTLLKALGDLDRR